LEFRACCRKRHVDRVARKAYQETPAAAVVALRVADFRFLGAAAFTTISFPCESASVGSCQQEESSLSAVIVAAIALGDLRICDRNSGRCFDRLGRRVAVGRIAFAQISAHDPGASIRC